MRQKNEKTAEKGFTFIEVIIAVSLLAIAASIIVGMMGASVQRGLRDRYAQQAILAGRRIMAALEANEDQIQPFEQTAPIMNLFETFKLPSPTDKDEIALLEQLQGTLKIEPWEVPEVDPEAMRKITLSVNWGADEDQSVEILYFAPRDKT